MLIQPEYQEKIAQGVARGIQIYLATLPEKAGLEEPAAETKEQREAA